MKNVLLLLSLMLSLSAVSQTQKLITYDVPANNVFKGVEIKMPGFREINSGAKLIVYYEGDWPEEMKGAFEYAVKIWEENLPITLPISITAKIASLRGDNSVLSKVTYRTFNFNGSRVSQYSAPTSMVKSVLLQEAHMGQLHRFYDEIDDISILQATDDITITYNKNLLDQFSFSLDEIVSNQYDFVTVALRDIARGLGFHTEITANSQTKTINYLNDRYSPFSDLIIHAIGTDNSSQAYLNATKGYVPLILSNWLGQPYEEVRLYAPNPWVNGISLNGFIPEQGKPLTQLLTYNFGKGYVMRNLSGTEWKHVFCGALDWRAYYVTGSTSAVPNCYGTTENELPYKGSVTFSFDNVTKNKQQDKKPSDSITELTNYSYPSENISYNAIEYCAPYHLFYTGNKNLPEGISICVLLKNGKWDCIYTNGNSRSPITLNIESLKLNYPASDYARATGGGLRYRVTKKLIPLFPNEYEECDAIYFTRDFTPQKANIKYSRIHEAQKNEIPSIRFFPDQFSVDVEIGLSNLEGTTKVVVEQTDEGETVPFLYEVPDFRKGYFIANLDRELSTTFTVISYNENGFTRSNTIMVPAIGYPDNKISFTQSREYIQLENLNSNLLLSGNLSCRISNITNPSITTDAFINRDGKIDIGTLDNGIYIINIFNGGTLLYNGKFAK